MRGALEAEMRAFAMDKDLSGNYIVSWNHLEFEVLYECLSDELKIGKISTDFNTSLKQKPRYKRGRTGPESPPRYSILLNNIPVIFNTAINIFAWFPIN